MTVDEAELKQFADVAKQALEAKLKFVKIDWITECIKQANMVSTKNYEIVCASR